VLLEVERHSAHEAISLPSEDETGLATRAFGHAPRSLERAQKGVLEERLVGTHELVPSRSVDAGDALGDGVSNLGKLASMSS
jgi:hypothetical protein